MVMIRNWREVQPNIAHLSAIHWGGLRRAEKAGDADDRNCLQRLDGFARHALQGCKTSDHHRHENLEQVYYVLSGGGEVLFGEERYPVREGDAVYLVERTEGIEVRVGDPEFADAVKAAEGLMGRYRNALAELAK